MSDASAFPIASLVEGNPGRPVRTMLGRIFTHDVAGLHGLNLERFAWTFIAVVAFATQSSAANALLYDEPLREFAKLFVGSLFGYVGTFFPAMLTITIADNLPLHRVARAVALTLALLAGVIATHPTICMLDPSSVTCEGFPSWQTLIRASPFHVFGTFTIGGVIAIAYFSLRRDRELTAALHAAEMERVGIERRTLESDLQVMQARVEPEFLLGTLREVARLCDTDPKTSERVLEKLVVYLRAALPDLRGSSSTLGREIELVRAWLAIAGIRSGGRVSFSVDAGPDLDEAKFPPMMLLPLVASAMPAGIQSPDSLTTRIAASRKGPALRVRIGGASIGARSTATAEPLNVARERLRILYGHNASLEIETNDEPEIVLQIPFER